jgi:hypothetical protein
LGLAETGVALLGYGLYAGLIAAMSLMAAAWTATLAQAATLSLLLVVTSWAIDASEGFAALAWLGRALAWSTTTQLSPMEHGTLAVGSCAWMVVVSAGALGAGWVGLRYDLSALARGLLLVLVLVVTAAGCVVAQGMHRGFDLTETERASLPPAIVRGLRALPGGLVLDVWLDRDDARRQQLESDALAKLRLARPDLEMRAPTDRETAPTQGQREPGYGRIVLHVGAKIRETYSTSRRELVTLIIEAAGRPLPDFSQPEYRGHPLVVEGSRRSFLAAVAYVGAPAALLLLGWFCVRPGRRNA